MVFVTLRTTRTSQVSYYPSVQDGIQFEALSASSTSRLGTLPHGFPKSLESNLVWKGREIENESKRWTLDLTEQDLDSIDEAMEWFNSTNLELSDMNRDRFPVSDALSRRLRIVSERCYDGIGFCIVRGIDPEKYTSLQNIIIFAGISAHVAPDRGFQDKESKEVLCHVINRTLLQNAVQARETPAFTDGALSFHTDFGEILALSTIKVDNGGDLLLSSAWQIYNELAVSRPDIVRVLSKDWLWNTYHDRKDTPPLKMPLLTYHDGKMIMNCSRYSLAGFGSIQRDHDLPSITAEQVEALDAIHFIATRNSIRLPSQKGDLLYVNNMALMHARDSIDTKMQANGSQALSARHKLRLCLRDPQYSWKSPPQMKRIWNQLYGSNTTDGRRDEHWIIQPEEMSATRWKANG